LAASRVTLDFLNQCDAAEFSRQIGDVFEHAPWVAGQVAPKRPFATVKDLHAALFTEVAEARRETQIAFFANHPELAGRAARAGDVTPDSLAEQGGAGLHALKVEQQARLEDLNRTYREYFGFPFLICVRRHTLASLFSAFEARISHSPDEEVATALREVFYITRLRLADRVEGPGSPSVYGRLSTHVLDTTCGKPAGGVHIQLHEVSDGLPGTRLKEVTTNEDGRTDAPLISNQPLRIGDYQLDFHLGAYFRTRASAMTDAPFLTIVPIRFSIAEPESHYHVPLLASPWSYTTYRGS
jgi:2-oxo-4-hydroxy-4-carboxy-5-ureidoimidazoline decarboxylase